MHPTLSSLPLPNSDHEQFVHVVTDLLTPAECEELIASHTSNLVRLDATYSQRLRKIYDDEALAELLWERLKPFYCGMKVVDDEGQVWTASHLNTKFRFCKYEPGDAFGPHYDGRYFPALDLQSFMTINIYLNDVPMSAGGATRFLDLSQPREQEGDRYKVLAEMRPVKGSAALFRDLVYHDGEPLKEGVKYLLRTDIMFERDITMDFDSMYGNLDDDRKGRKALDLAQRLEDSGSSKDAVFWYRKAFRLCPELEREA